MAVAIENVSAVLEDGGSYTVDGGGTNRLLLALSIASDNESGSSSLTDYQLNSQTLTNPGITTDGDEVPWFKMTYGYLLDGVAGSGTFDFVIDSTFINSGSVITELSGVNQSSPITSFEALKDEDVDTLSHTINAPTGSFVKLMVSSDSGNAISPPSALGGVDSWTTQHDGDSGLVGGGMANGSVYTTIASTDHTSVAVASTTASTANNYASVIIVVAPAGGVTVDCTSQSFTWTDFDPSVSVGVTVNCGSQSFTWTDNNASVDLATVVDCTSQAFTWSDNAASIVIAIDVDCTSEAFTWTDYDPEVEVGVTVNCTSQAFTWTDNAASVASSVTVNCTSQTFTWTDNAASVVVAQPSFTHGGVAPRPVKRRKKRETVVEKSVIEEKRQIRDDEDAIIALLLL